MHPLVNKQRSSHDSGKCVIAQTKTKQKKLLFLLIKNVVNAYHAKNDNNYFLNVGLLPIHIQRDIGNSQSFLPLPSTSKGHSKSKMYNSPQF